MQGSSQDLLLKAEVQGQQASDAGAAGIADKEPARAAIALLPSPAQAGICQQLQRATKPQLVPEVVTY